MRLLYVHLVGYVGIYNGLGKKQIEIDFTKCKNNICVISGPNGCGKSTLLNALNILPDSRELLVPSMNASKTIRLADIDIVYDINILYPIDGNGNRAQTKAYIQKNGVELNQNGNVTSFKDIVFNEFDLDSNYITLSHLSGDDRGLADKKPAERKKFLASISDSLDVYNDIYKNLNKKANTYKSYINNLTGKIKAIGDESNLRSGLVSLSNRESKLTDNIEVLKAEIIQNQTILQVNDPDGKLQERYQSIESDLSRASENNTKVLMDMRSFYESNFDTNRTELDKEKLLAEVKDIQSQIEFHKNKKSDNSAKILVLTNSIQNSFDRISANEVKIANLSAEINPELDSQIEIYKKRLSEIESEFESVGIHPEYISKSEIDQLISILVDFIKAIDLLYESCDSIILPELIAYKVKGERIADVINKINDTNNTAVDEIHFLNSDIDKLLADQAIVEELDKRPKDCKIDNCYFLSKAFNTLSIYGSKENMYKKYKELADKREKLINETDNYEKHLSRLKNMLSSEAILDKITTLIESNRAILSKFSIITGLTDFKSLYKHISDLYVFNEYRDLSVLQSISNDIIEYNQIDKIYNSLLSEQKTNTRNIKESEELQKEVSNLKESINTDKSNRDQLIKDNDFLDGLIINCENRTNMITELISKYDLWVDTDNKYKLLEIEFKNLQKQFEGSADILQRISKAQQDLLNAKNELEPITDQKKGLESQLLLLESYNKEYNEYSEKYIVIDKLKRYSSPTGGIQALFMSMYMNKTLDLANQLLSMIFQGQYRLLEYVINQDEFRMPFIGNGLTVDDISSGSTSQVCIMGMIINLVLLNQASTKYNITRLDEIDGGLDHANRYMFVDILQKIIQILNIEQLFIISHSVESALSNVDVIELAEVEDYENVFTGANVIYSYKENHE